jgi:hypothetical protein
MPRAGFEPEISTFERQKTILASDRSVKDIVQDPKDWITINQNGQTSELTANCRPTGKRKLGEPLEDY